MTDVMDNATKQKSRWAVRGIVQSDGSWQKWLQFDQQVMEEMRDVLHDV